MHSIFTPSSVSPLSLLPVSLTLPNLIYPLLQNLMNLHIQPHPKLPSPPLNRHPSPKRYYPNRQRTHFAAQPRGKELAEVSPRAVEQRGFPGSLVAEQGFEGLHLVVSLGGALREHEIWRVGVNFDGFGRVQEEVLDVIDDTPEGHVGEPDQGEREPGWGYADAGEEWEGSESVCAVKTAEYALGARLDEGC